MPDEAILKRSRTERICDELRAQIESTGPAAGRRLSTVRELARRYEASVPTVQRALDQLEDEGLVVRRHGSGTFIADHRQVMRMGDAALLCLDVRGHVWGQLAGMMVHRLQARHRFAGLIDETGPNVERLLQRLSEADPACFVFRGQRHFPLRKLPARFLGGRRALTLVDWDFPEVYPGLARVLSDYEKGARLVAGHLRSLGHQRLLVLGTAIQTWFVVEERPNEPSPLQTAVRNAVTEQGFQWQALASHAQPDGREALDAGSFCRLMSGPDAPTAIFAMRDYEALAAQRLLRRHMPDRADRIAIVGYFDTPWSDAGDPPITTVNLNLEEIADRAVELTDRLVSGEPAPETPVLVSPRLVVRETSVAV